MWQPDRRYAILCSWSLLTFPTKFHKIYTELLLTLISFSGLTVLVKFPKTTDDLNMRFCIDSPKIQLKLKLAQP